MQPLTRGWVVLAIALAVWSCSSDPTESIRDGDARIVADPASLFLSQGESTFVVVQLLDPQGNQLETDFEASGGDGAITVTRDDGFLPVPGGTIRTRSRFNVLANTPGVSSFTVTAGGASLEIPVKVLPTSVTASFSNAAPAVNEPVTVTAPGFIFYPGAQVIFGVDTAIVLDVAEDGSSITFLPNPGSIGTAIIDSVGPSFLPGVKTSLPTDVEIAVPAATAAAGSGATGTAPTIPFPTAIGETVRFFEGGEFTGADITGDGGVGAQYYQFTVAEDGDYNFVTNWPGTSDLDAIVCFDAACSDGAFAGSGLDHPEDGTLTLTAGTYFFASVLFAGSAPPWFSLTVTRQEPPTGE